MSDAFVSPSDMGTFSSLLLDSGAADGGVLKALTAPWRASTDRHGICES